ncbi:ribosomal RNA processing protein 36 homolog [Toxorhynchites rutilus septentrionalis]|uniref:ribosomal RNA processing protein 36 homolog n=1 Tax=Toxorhynchites rutilus septentrionalis TaxID=329112 RepID=UPI002478BD99|nr:ribosomal RNA processing protein 36 homolog [Toxorhynchites rutilus septentrionalis]
MSSGSEFSGSEQENSDIEDNQTEQSSDNKSNSSQSDDDEENDSDDGSKPKLADDDFRQMPFEELLQLKRRLGSKVYNEAVFGKTKNSKDQTAEKKKANKRQQPSTHDSDSDGPPVELSAKRKVSALGMEKKRNESSSSRRDPRFDAKQGYYSGRQFREKYAFINEMRNDELERLQKQLETVDDPDEAEQLKFAIRRTENQIREFNKQKEQDKKRKEEHLEARKAIEDGKRPFYEKKSIKKARELVEKYDELKETGRLGKHIDKRRRKTTAKDRKKLDFST